ncbi:MAG TPA: SAM-dependent chlorinase/fluorinase [Mycobacteriales bacterium]|nr:SAM-dependent chlorinase/fluorinase [Mycobacteriales bacterium]
MPIDKVSLLTDYGTYDGFVAACHGVITQLAPKVRLIDITHEVPPADVRRGAVVLAQTVPYLPQTVHVGVVDPGVGSSRRGVALQTPDGLFVGPDNGLLIWAAEASGGIERAVTLSRTEFHLPVVTATFHGRDVFAPVAGHLAAGLDLAAIGEPIDPAGLVRLPQPLRQAAPGRIECEVLTVDRFGNVQTSAGTAELAAAEFPDRGRVRVNERELPFGGTFSDVAIGAPLSYVDSAGMLAIAVNRGDAAVELGLHAGTRLDVRRS